MENPHKYLDDDKHLCIRCKSTIIGLGNYVFHRKNECQEPYSSSPTDLAPHLHRDSEVNYRYDISDKPQADQVSQTFSNDVIDLSTTTKRNLNSSRHSSILFPSTSLDSNSEHKDSNKLCKTYANESYTEPYGDIESYQSHYISNRDQSLFIDYRSTGNEQTRKEIFAAPSNFSSSSDMFHQEHHETSGISLFRSFETFNESFKSSQDLVRGSYLSQNSNKYISEGNTFDNKFTEIYTVTETESILGSVTHSKSDHYKSKLLSNPVEDTDRQNLQKQDYYEEDIAHSKLDETNIPECNAKNSCSNDAVDFSKQDIRQNDFLSSLELTSNVTKKIMKYELDMEDDEDYDDSRPPSHYTGGKWPPGTEPPPRESRKWIFSPRSVEEDSQDGFDELNDNTMEQHQHAFQPPPPSYTKGKWLPGKRLVDNNKYNSNEEYEGKPCNRSLKGKAAYERHLRSELHLVKEKKICDQEENITEPTSRRPLRAKKQEAQIFLKQKISLIKNKRNKKRSQDIESDISNLESKLKDNNERKSTATIPFENSDESDRDELHKNKCPKVLCPICRLSFSNVYSSNHFASLAHIHNELEFNKKPNMEVRKKYDKIILKNVKLFTKISYFLCKPCKFYTNSHDDLECHINSHEDECQSSQTKMIYTCSACPDDTDMYNICDLKRHLQVSQHRKNVRFEIFHARQVVMTYNIEILCVLCSRTFRYNKMYRNHRRIFHEEKSFQLVDQRLSKCSECPFQTTTEHVVRKHLKKVHHLDCSTSYFCFVCGLRFDTNSEASAHRHSSDHRIVIEKQKGKSNERTCNVCYAVLNNISILRQHMKETHEKELTPCFHCGVTFPLRADLTAHRKTCSKVVVDLERLYKCDLCSFANDLLAHVLMHTLVVHYEKGPTELYSCHICKSKLQGRSIKNHMLLHTKEQSFSCVHCSRRFSEEKWLERHLCVVHSTTPKRRRCLKEGSKENKVAPSGIKGLEQVKSVTKSCKVFLCEICGRTYANKSHLKRHQNEQHAEGFVAMETGCRPVNSKKHYQKQTPISKSLVCEVCGVLCGNSTLLKTHRQKHRNSGYDGETYPCPHCSYSTPRIHHLKRHLRLHTGATPFKCPYCNYSANNQENLRKHMLKTQKHSGRFMYECQLCLQEILDQEDRRLERDKDEEEDGGRVDKSRPPEEEEEGEGREGSALRNGGERRPFGSNFASTFKDHLISRHRTHFADKEEVSRHIRSYYHPENDSTFTENPKLFKYKFKKRVRKSKCEIQKYLSSADENVVIEENNYIADDDVNTADITRQHFSQFNIDINRQGRGGGGGGGDPLKEERLPLDPHTLPSPSSFLPSSSGGLISPEGGSGRVVNDMQALTCLAQEKVLGLPSCSFKREENMEIFPQTKRIKILVNKEAKKTYILKNEDLDLKDDANIPIGAEVVLRDSQQQDGQNISWTEQSQSSQTNSSREQQQTINLTHVSNEGCSGFLSEVWHSGHDWVAQETKVQNVVSKKVYLLVSNEKDIENHIKDILPALQ